MAGSATITGRQNYVLGIGHPKTETTTEAPPAIGMISPNGSVQGVSFGENGDLTHGVLVDGVDDPTSAPIPALGSAGTLTGTYGYAVSFVTESGETAVWPGTAPTVTASSKRINLSSIPVSQSSNVIARNLYRTIGSAVDVKDYFFLATINDNTTTTFEDNVADGSLGSAAPWLSTTKGFMNLDGGPVAAFGSGQALAIGVGASATRKGYANTSIGFEALKVNSSGRRNTALGVYALTANTTGFNNTAVGVHAFNTLTTASSGTALGYGAAFSNATGNFITAVGFSSCFFSTGGGHTAVGFESLKNNVSGTNCVAIGRNAGTYSLASNQFWVDNQDRGNLATQQANGLIWGVFDSAPANQRLTVNAVFKPLTTTVAALPSAATAGVGFKAMVTDAASPTFLATVAGGGAVVCPVFSDGTNWKVG